MTKETEMLALAEGFASLKPTTRKRAAIGVSVSDQKLIVDALRAAARPAPDAEDKIVKTSDGFTVRTNSSGRVKEVLGGPSQSFQAPDAGLVEREALRKLVDVVWNEATESTAVPSTKWADKLIDRALSMRPAVAEPVATLPPALKGAIVAAMGQRCRLMPDDDSKAQARRDLNAVTTWADATPAPSGRDPATIEACAKVCDDLRHKDYSAESVDWLEGTADCATAIRAFAAPAVLTEER